MATRDDLQQGWYVDPFGRFDQRWWDGSVWTEKIRDVRGSGIDPPGINPAPVAIGSPAPAAPIEDALMPIPRPRIADKLAVLFACVVFLALIAVLVASVTS